MRTASGPQTVAPARDEIQKPAVAEILQLLADFRPDVLVAGIEFAEIPVERIDLIQRELALAERLHAFHDVEQPSPSLRRLAAEKEGSLPFGEHQLLGANDPVLHDVNLAGLRNAAEQDVRTDPSRAPRRGR